MTDRCFSCRKRSGHGQPCGTGGDSPAAIGHLIAAGESPFAEWAQAAQIPDGLRDHLPMMYEDYDQYGFPGGNAIVLRTILGREPRSLQQYFQALVSSKVD